MNFLEITASICLAMSTQSPISDLKRISDEPILSPRAGQVDEAGAYNPTAAKVGDAIVLLYRAQDKKGVSVVGRAESKDGIHFKAQEPALMPEAPYELGGGIEDPRLQKIDGTYYLTYTGYNKKDAQLCLATSKDLKTWTRQGVIMPAYKGTWNEQWTKSGAIVPEKIDGKYWMYYLGTTGGADEMGLASSTDLLHWSDATDKPVLPKRPEMFDSRVVEPGPAPVLTDEGILLIYNGADKDLIYKTGWVLFDRKNPTKVLRRAEQPIFAPEKNWEKVGQVPNVVFVEGLIQDGAKLRLYYGGADTHTGVAECQLTGTKKSGK